MTNTQPAQHPVRQTAQQIERLLLPTQTADLLGVSLSWLAKARLRGDGPRYVKIGRSVRYPESAVRDYIRARTRTSTSQQ